MFFTYLRGNFSIPSPSHRSPVWSPPVVIVANKKDLEFDRMVSREEGEGLSRGLKLPFHEISARDSWEETLAAFHSVYTNVAQQLEAAPACFRRRTVSRLMEKIPRIHSGSGFSSFRDLLPD
uniref:small monomeric GTPase n=1 Tax=Denticeps clupeoides TaxID=299321 RepID=A0AAY4DJS9_9TELE